MDLAYCAKCEAVAEVQWRAVMESTEGPIEHAKVLCARRHWFFLPVADLAQPRVPLPGIPRRSEFATEDVPGTSRCRPTPDRTHPRQDAA